MHSCPQRARPMALPASTTGCFNSCCGFLGPRGTAAWGLEWLKGWWDQEAACLGGRSAWGTQGLTLCLHVAGRELWLARSPPWGCVPLMCSKPGFIHGASSSASASPKCCLGANQRQPDICVQDQTGDAAWQPGCCAASLGVILRMAVSKFIF